MPAVTCRPSGPGWLHEIKHDGYRLMARLITSTAMPQRGIHATRDGVSLT
jgi:hypothetical protein